MAVEFFVEAKDSDRCAGNTLNGSPDTEMASYTYLILSSQGSSLITLAIPFPQE